MNDCQELLDIDFEWDEIVSIEEIGEEDCYDIMLFEQDTLNDEPNFVADGVIVHNCGMDARYCARKKYKESKGKEGEPYNLHPVVEKILGKTYGVMVFQEQIMDILRVVGKIPDMHTEKVRKAISKKKVKEFIKYKEMFIENGQEVLNTNKEFVEELWDQVQAFSEYGFNKTIDEDTIILMPDGAKKIKDFKSGDRVLTINEHGRTVETEVLNLHDHGILEGYEVTFDDGYSITCTLDHKFLTKDGQQPLWQIIKNNVSVLCDPVQGDNYAKEKDRGMDFCLQSNISQQTGVGKTQRQLSGMCEFRFQYGSDEVGVVGCVPEYAPISDIGRLVSRKVVRVVSVGKRQMYDLEVASATHNFLLPNGIATSNSHATAYSYISARLLWLKTHYPIEFYTAILMCKDDENKFREYKLDAKYHGVQVVPVDINKSSANFSIVDDKIYFGFSNIKGISDIAQKIVDNQPYAGFQDFLNRFGTDAGAVKPLVALGVFDKLEPNYNREQLRKYYEYYKDQFKKYKDVQKRLEKSLADRDADLKEMLLTQLSESDPEFEKLCSFSEESRKLWEETFSHVMVEVETTRKGVVKSKMVSFLDQLQSLAQKRDKRAASNTTTFEIKALDGFNFDSIILDDEELALLRSEMVIDGVVSYPEAESTYYGFQWTHILETNPDYTGLTIDSFLAEAEENHMKYGPVEVMVLSSERRTSKNNVVFYTVRIEDANSRRMNMNVWKEDFARWEEEFSAGNMLRIQARPPSGGFMTLTLNSYPKGKMPPKEEDGRIIVLESVNSNSLDDLTLN